MAELRLEGWAGAELEFVVLVEFEEAFEEDRKLVRG